MLELESARPHARLNARPLVINPQAPDKSGEETSVPVAHRDEQGNALEVEIKIAGVEEGEPKKPHHPLI